MARTASLRHICKHKVVVYFINTYLKYVFFSSRLSHVRILQVMHHLYPFLTAARIIKCIVLMADCDSERIMCL